MSKRGNTMTDKSSKNKKRIILKVQKTNPWCLYCTSDIVPGAYAKRYCTQVCKELYQALDMKALQKESERIERAFDSLRGNRKTTVREN